MYAIRSYYVFHIEPQITVHLILCDFHCREFELLQICKVFDSFQACNVVYGLLLRQCQHKLAGVKFRQVQGFRLADFSVASYNFV